MKKVSKGLALSRETVARLASAHLGDARGGSQINDTVYHPPKKGPSPVIVV